MNRNLKLMAVALATVGLVAGSYTPSAAASPMEEDQRIITQLAGNTPGTVSNPLEQQKRILAEFNLLMRKPSSTIASPAMETNTLEQQKRILAEFNQLMRKPSSTIASPAMETNTLEQQKRILAEFNLLMRKPSSTIACSSPTVDASPLAQYEPIVAQLAQLADPTGARNELVASAALGCIIP